MEVKFSLPREEMVRLFLTKLENDIAGLFGRFGTSVVVDTDRRSLMFDILFGQPYDEEGLKALAEDPHISLSTPENQGGLLALKITVDAPPPVLQMKERIEQFTDLILSLPEILDRIYEVLHPSGQENSQGLQQIS